MARSPAVEAGTLVRGCSEEDGEVEVRPVGSGLAEEISCARQEGADCLLSLLPAGEYLARQWPFSTRFTVDATGMAPPVSLVCRRECAIDLLVHAERGCEGPGTAELRYWGDAARGPEATIASVPWTNEESVEIDGLPCLPLALLRVSGTGCEVHQHQLPLDPIRQTVELRLIGNERLTLRIVDAGSGLPIEGARVRCPYYNGPIAPSGVDGEVELQASTVSNHSAVVLAAGYANSYLIFSDLDGAGLIGEDGTIEVPLLPTSPAWVDCTDEGAPCGGDVKVWVDAEGLDREHQDCVLEGRGRWRCEATERDRAYVMAADRRRARPTPIAPGEAIEISLPSPKGQVCLRWTGPSPCRLEVEPLGDGSAIPRGYEIPTLGTGEPSAFPARPGEALGAVLWCGERGWTGEIEASEPGSTACLEVELVEGGSICLDQAASIRLDLGSTWLARTSWDVRLEGCSGLIPAGRWSVERYGEDLSGLVSPGETWEAIHDSTD